MELNDKPINISITTFTIVKILAIFLLIYFLYLIRDILLIFFISLILTSAVHPWVDWLHRRKIPRSLGILSFFFILFVFIGLIIYLILPPIIQEIGDLSANFPQFLNKVTSTFSSLKDFSSKHGILQNIQNSLGGISANLQSAAGGVFSAVANIFGGIFSFFLILVLTFYMTVEENAIRKLVKSIAPEKHHSYIMQLISRMQVKIGLWLRGQLIICFTVFLMEYIGLSLLGIKYALVLALIGGVAEFIPYIGPIIGAVPGIFLAFTQSPTLALFATVMYYLVHLTEGNLLVPKIMERTVGLNPIISIAALLIGYQIAGIPGAILSIPVATAIAVFFKDVFDLKASDRLKEE